MTYATITLLHKLLEDHVDFMDEAHHDATRELEETYALHEADAERGSENAKLCIDAAIDRRRSAMQELNEAQKALDDFEKHDWH